MGFLRLYLAVAVMMWHSAPGTSRLFPFSYAAVICFFIISGFYISMVLTERYRDETARFYLNRAVRLYPAYLAVLAVAGLAHHLGVAGAPGLGSAWQAIGQVTILPRVVWDTLMLTPGPHPDAIYDFTVGPVYTVGLEMLFYLLAPFFVRRRVSVLLYLLAISFVVHLAPRGFGLEPRNWQYEFFPGVSVFFILGALSYRLYRIIKGQPWTQWIGYAAIPLIVGYIWVIDNNGHGSYANNALIYVLYLGVATLIPFLFVTTKRSPLDRFLGSMSYPLYIVHAIVINIVAATGWQSANWIARGISIVAAVALAALIERPLESVRSKIREGSHPTSRDRRSAIAVSPSLNR